MLSAHECMRPVATISYKPVDRISPNLVIGVLRLQVKMITSRSRSLQGQTFEWVIVAGGGIHIVTWALKCHLVC